MVCPSLDVLPEEDSERAFTEEGVAFAQNEDCVYTPHVTLGAFLSQVLHKGEQRSCLAAVSRILVLRISLGLDACAKNSGTYCKTRAKLPTKVIRRLATELADGCEQAVPPHWLWPGRHVKLVDGTTVSMPDTEANQHEYPQQSAQAAGLGFPIARMIVLLSLATGMDQQTYEQIPETITLRLVEIKVSEPGFRTRSLVVVRIPSFIRRRRLAAIGQVQR